MTILAALDPAGPGARAAEDLWWLMLWLGVPVFVLVTALLVLGIRRRRRADADVADPREDVGGTWVVAGGVVLPLVVVGVVFIATVSTMSDTPWSAPDGAVEIEVEAYQFAWSATHVDADGATLDDELVVPVGRPVLLRITSRDVIHSFWVPELAGKMDALPERTNELVVQADRPGQYAGRCAEYCGLGHAEMPLVVVALDDDDYERWLADPGSVRDDPPPSAGLDRGTEQASEDETGEDSPGGTSGEGA